jgi:hypothetical protein
VDTVIHNDNDFIIITAGSTYDISNAIVVVVCIVVIVVIVLIING